MANLAVGTVVAKNYLPFARVLADSFLRFHPDIPLYVVLADEPEGYFDTKGERFELLALEDLGIPELENFRFRYNRQQAVIAAKPYLLGHLLDRGFTSAVFFDADILILNGLDTLFDAAARHDLVLTPHVYIPLIQGRNPARELNFLQSGTYNGGFVGLRESGSSRRFLRWWQDRLSTHCRHAVREGMHYDQRWLDFAPAFVEDLHILREPEYNVAYWNLPERKLAFEDDVLRIDDRPCGFFHFSGFDPERPARVTKYSPEMTMAEVYPADALFDRYQRLINEAGYGTTRSWPWAYDHFDNGVPTPGLARKIHAELGQSAGQFGDPLQTAPPTSYFRWLTEPVEGGVTRLWSLIYERRPDVRKAFPDRLGKDREAFLSWAETHGANEHDICGELLPERA